VLVRLEERFASHLEASHKDTVRLDDVERRTGQIEIVMPSLRETRTWFITGVMGILGLLGLQIWSVVIGGPISRAQAVRPSVDQPFEVSKPPVEFVAPHSRAQAVRPSVDQPFEVSKPPVEFVAPQRERGQ
jgi:hypothetical protein